MVERILILPKIHITYPIHFKGTCKVTGMAWSELYPTELCCIIGQCWYISNTQKLMWIDVFKLESGSGDLPLDLKLCGTLLLLYWSKFQAGQYHIRRTVIYHARLHCNMISCTDWPSGICLQTKVPVLIDVPLKRYLGLTKRGNHHVFFFFIWF